MPARRISNPKVGVLTDREAIRHIDESVFADGMYLRQAPDEHLAHALERLLDAQVDLVAVIGPDAFVGRVLTVHQRRLRRHPTPLRLFLVSTGSQTTVARALGAPKLTPKTFRRLKSSLLDGGLNRRLVPTLKVSSSARPAADWGFSFGAGLFYRLFEAYHRAGASPTGAGTGALVAQTLGRIARDTLLDGASLRPARGRVTVDKRPAGESVGYLLASSLERSWLGLGLLEDRATSYRMGQSGKTLLKQVAKSKALPRFLGAASGVEPFETIHIDWSEGYVLDGELYEPEKPYVVQITEGMLAHFVTL